jgi:tyrosine-protein phosphatase SIW14
MQSTTSSHPSPVAHHHGSAEVFVPPINFAMLCSGVYRSGYPTKKNFRFLQAMKLRSICYLCPEEYGQTNMKFCEEHGVNVLRFPMEGNKEPFVDIPEGIVHRVLSALCDTRNHPIMIHCNKGKHRTGTICGCLRKVQGWSLVSILDEYVRFAGDKARVGDQQYIELYMPIVCVPEGGKHAAHWMESSPTTQIVHSDVELVDATSRQLEVSLLRPEIPSQSGAGSTGAGGSVAGEGTKIGEEALTEEQLRKKEKKEKKAKEAAAIAAAAASTATVAASAGRSVST